jgi:hypothetical protein
MKKESRMKAYYQYLVMLLIITCLAMPTIAMMQARNIKWPLTSVDQKKATYFNPYKLNANIENDSVDSLSSLRKEKQKYPSKNPIRLYRFNHRFALTMYQGYLYGMLPVDIENYELYPDILTLFNQYQEAMNNLRQKDSQFSTPQSSYYHEFIEVFKKYQDMYQLQYPVLKDKIVHYYKTRYQDILKALTMGGNVSDYGNMYESAYNYFIKHEPGFDTYYDLALVISFFEFMYTSSQMQEKIQLNEYILKYAKKNEGNAYDSFPNFGNYRVNGIYFKGNQKPLALYDPHDEKITFKSPDFLSKISLTEQAFTILHELAHAGQDPKMDGYNAEQYADRQACQEIKCSVCLRIYGAVRGDTPFDSRYHDIF